MRSARGLLLDGSLHPRPSSRRRPGVHHRRIRLEPAAIDADISTQPRARSHDVDARPPRPTYGHETLDRRLLATCLQSTHPARVENPMKAAFLYDPRMDSFGANWGTGRTPMTPSQPPSWTTGGSCSSAGGPRLI